MENPFHPLSYKEASKKFGIPASVLHNDVKRGYSFKGYGGIKDHPLLSIYQDMLRRCYDPKRREYKYWGARGIRVCGLWFYSFEAFVKDMGPRPEGFTLDRIDVDGNYCQENCRWASWDTQANNRRPLGTNITPDIIERVNQLKQSKMSYNDIAKCAGISRRKAIRICVGDY